MKLGILRMGPVDSKIVKVIEQGLSKEFPQAECIVLQDIMLIPEDTYNRRRKQYHSTRILTKIADYTKEFDVNIVLTVTEADLYASSLNFVFGEAQYPGKACVISLFRLRPKFYGQPNKKQLLLERAMKEAVHEVGHALGLGHCENSLCVMFFSNTINDTDTKKSTFCNKCHRDVLKVLGKK